MENNIMNKLTLSLPQCLLVVASGLWLTGCALYADSESQSHTSNASITSAYPPPATVVPTAPPPLPTEADGSSNYSAFATPSPDETVGITGISEVAPETGPASRYSVEDETINGKPSHWRALYLIDSVTGNRVRLGDNNGSASYGLLSDDYMLWFFLCDSCPSEGLHAYSLRTGEDVLVAEDAYALLGSVKIAGNWVVYVTSPDSQLRTAQLHAYNLQTGMALLVTNNVHYRAPEIANYFTINENKVAWAAVDLTIFKQSVNVYDLQTQTAQTLVVEEKSDPRYLSVSRSVVVWWDGFWRGYDLTHDALFTIPVVPPGWNVDSIRGAGPVTVRGRQIFWVLDVNGQARHFTASVVERGPTTPEPTYEVPVPTTTVEPTSYP
jgi:hypothetical protein